MSARDRGGLLAPQPLVENAVGDRLVGSLV
jgi:hypothetical protein